MGYSPTDIMNLSGWNSTYISGTLSSLLNPWISNFQYDLNHSFWSGTGSIQVMSLRNFVVEPSGPITLADGRHIRLTEYIQDQLVSNSPELPTIYSACTVAGCAALWGIVSIIRNAHRRRVPLNPICRTANVEDGHLFLHHWCRPRVPSDGMLIDPRRLVRAVVGAASFAFIFASPACLLAGQTGRSFPLAGEGAHPVVYYYDYSADGVTSDQIIHDLTNNTTDSIPLVNPNAYYSFLGNPPVRDDLATSLVDGSSHLDNVGGAARTTLPVGEQSGTRLPAAHFPVVRRQCYRPWRYINYQKALTHQNISDAGGFTFETYVMRTTDTTGVAGQKIWTPEGAQRARDHAGRQSAACIGRPWSNRNHQRPGQLSPSRRRVASSDGRT